MKYLKYLVFFIVCIPFNIEALEINSKHAILYNMNDDTVIFEKNADERTYIASLTKIMTTIVAIENIDNVYEYVTIPAQALEGLIEANAAVAGFKLGQKVTYLDLLYGVLLPSGADATKTLAYYISGNEDNFVKLMNNKAKELGLSNTHFANTSGLDTDNHYSTVREISVILKYALKNPLFKQIYTTNKYTTSDNTLTFRSVFSNYLNRFNLTNNYIYGSKTGYTNLAGYCLSSIANYNNIEYLLITTNANGKINKPLHIMDAFMIYDYYMINYHYLDIISKGEPIITLDTKNSKEKQITITADRNITKYLQTSITKDYFKFDYNGLQQLDYFTKEGQIGTIDILLNGEIIDSISVIYSGGLTFSLISFLANNIIAVLFIILILIVVTKKLLKK